MPSVGVKAIQPTFKNRLYRPPASYADEVFHCIFGPFGNHITTAVDLSPINAPISFHGAAEINTGASAIQSPGPNPSWPSALQCPSNGSYVEVPPNDAYNFGYKDFTIEFFFTPTNVVNPAGPIQLIGVWDGPLIENQSWRIVTDVNYHHFQWIEDGVMNEIKWHNTVPSSANWLKHIWERYLGRLMFWVEWSTGVVMIFGDGSQMPIIPFGKIDPPANPVPLRIGGTPTVAMLGYMRDVRLTAAAQYRGQLPPYQTAPFGYIMPSLITDPEVFPGHRIGNILVDPFLDTDTFYAPLIKRDSVARPTRIVDVDKFFVPDPNVFPDQLFIGPTYPQVSVTDMGDFPRLEDITTTSGSGLSATLTLPATRNPGDLLVMILQVATTNIDANSGWGASFTFVNGSNSGGGAGLGDSNWYSWRFRLISLFGLRAVDGTEVAPVVTFTSGDSLPSYNWTGHILRFSGCDVATPNWSWPIWDEDFYGQGRNNHVLSAQAPYSSSFYDPGPAPIYPNGLHYMVINTNTNEALALPNEHYTTRLQMNGAGGSIIAASLLAQARLQDDFGSGAIDQMIAEAAVWDATIFTLMGPYPFEIRHFNTIARDDVIYPPQVNLGLPP